ncbi:hypothetical protein [Fluoribacter gormanii]|uniref:DNA-binding domain-containing protein n=1 Tax=Fluoribacter gormanii TaxID=464 RepID=A0A377GG03_9GAMM|nr:hypothetical protein [Fluoribacter gormanii]KTD02732.1 hypothetical protein Lgor_1609 [Fluoribacter gormanii]SIR59822.1 hypothetical protein SAMN05421777_11685 [Fluoribacter gormanii]STO23749.1 Uncharacterised protein [Fluoribacter gormanii]
MNNQLIQQTLAKLITNPRYCENYDSLKNEIISTLNLSADVANMLDSFYNVNKQKFQASARILKKSRWDDIKASLPVTTGYLNDDVLQSLWESYLSHLQINSIVSKNPLSESILFLDYAEKSNLLSSLDKQIIKYEKTRNEVTYDHHNDFTVYSIINRNDNEPIDNLNNYKIYIHSCFRIESFSYNIPAILRNTSKDDVETDNTLILFFKNLKKEGIGTIKISADVKDLLLKSFESNSLEESYTYFQNKLSLQEFKQLFKKFEQIGVLSIQQIEK